MDGQHTAIGEHSRVSQTSESTNNHGTVPTDLPTDDPSRLSLSTAAATTLPSSSPATSPLRQVPERLSLSSGLPHLQKSPLRRTPSSSSFSNGEQSKTPTMHKRPSLSSLHSAGGSTPPRSPALRRTSSNLASPSHSLVAPRSDLSTPAEEPPQPIMTAASVARDCLGKELDLCHGVSNNMADSKTVVILHDNCYGHRYSRPRTSRAGLATIVERPERIHASILGLATAYVRLGGRHCEGHSPLNPKKQASSRTKAPFRIQKTARILPLTSQAATSIHGAKWMSELSNMCDAAESKLALNGKELTRPTSSEQTNGNAKSEKPKLHEGDLYLCSESLGALEGALGGVCEGVDAVFSESNAKRVFVCIRPPGHHCSADYPSGFCWLNNVHVGIGHAALAHGLTHAAIIDFDLHHGDGSQSITWAHNCRVASMPKNTPMSKKTAIGYFSLHDINSYPCEMGDEDKVRNASMCIENAHGQTIWNVHLQPWKSEPDFWALYESRYLVVLEKARTFLRSHTARLQQSPIHPQPKAAIFLSAGFDASEWESPGMQRHQVNVPTDFYARFTQGVVRLAEEEGLGVDGRVISVLEGGYSDRALMSGVLSHISGLTSMDRISHRKSGSSGLGQDMARRLGNLNLNGDLERHVEESCRPPLEAFDSKWWALQCLEEIENLVNPPAVPQTSKKQRNAVTPTYSSTTQSYSAKIVSPPLNRRSLSGNAPSYISTQSQHAKIPDQPPPPVGWAVAAHELSKLLIPTNRQTKSCKPEDLNAEATRARRDRQSTIGLPVEAPVADGKRMQLRERRAKVPKYASEDEEEKPKSRSDRRRTIADPAMLVHEAEPVPDLPTAMDLTKPLRPKSRRLSMASSAGSANGDRSASSSLGSGIVSDPPKEPLVVKKTRVPSGAPNPAPKPKVLRKAPPVPRVPSAYSATANPTTNPIDGDHVALDDEDIRNKDVDNIAIGMKKMSIKLNLPPTEVQEARETKTKLAARGRPKSTVPKKTEMTAKAKKPTKTETPSVVTHQSDTAPLPIISDRIPLPTDTQKPVLRDLPSVQSQRRPVLPTADEAQEDLSSEPRLDTNALDTIKLQPLDKSSVQEPLPMPPAIDIPVAFTAPANPTIPAQVSPIASNAPDDPPVVEATITAFPPPYHAEKAPPQSPAKFSHPETHPDVTPASPLVSSPKRSKQDLPVFTATSAILFGKPNPQASTIDQKITPKVVPTKSAPEHTPSAQLTGSDEPTSNGVALASSHSTSQTRVDMKEDAEKSIWDVPDTPQMKKR